MFSKLAFKFSCITDPSDIPFLFSPLLFINLRHFHYPMSSTITHDSLSCIIDLLEIPFLINFLHPPNRADRTIHNMPKMPNSTNTCVHAECKYACKQGCACSCAYSKFISCWISSLNISKILTFFNLNYLVHHFFLFSTTTTEKYWIVYRIVEYLMVSLTMAWYYMHPNLNIFWFTFDHWECALSKMGYV